MCCEEKKLQRNKKSILRKIKSQTQHSKQKFTLLSGCTNSFNWFFTPLFLLANSMKKSLVSNNCEVEYTFPFSHINPEHNTSNLFLS